MADAVNSTIEWHHDPENAAQAFAVAHILAVADEMVTMKGMGIL